MTKKTTTAEKTNPFSANKKTTESVVEEVVEKNTEIEKTIPVSTAKKKVKKFELDEGILCQSVAPGKTFFKGIKTGEIYTFEALGAEEYIEYRDLIASVRSRDNMLFKPFIMVLNEDFINEQTNLKNFYDSMYTPEDFEEFFTLTPKQMVEALNNMPVGIKETIKSMAAAKIEDHSFDSVARIKALDDYFGTQLMLLTGLFGDD